MGNSGNLTSCKSNATSFYQCVVWLSVCGGFVTWTQMLMHVIAHRDCVNTVGESALEVDSGRKIPCHIRELSPHQNCIWLFGPMHYKVSCPTPRVPWSTGGPVLTCCQSLSGSCQWPVMQRQGTPHFWSPATQIFHLLFVIWTIYMSW